MISQFNTGQNRDSNLNFKKQVNANDVQNVHIVDNQARNKSQNKNEIEKESNTCIWKSKDQAQKREEYDNYRNTFSDGKTPKISAQEESPNSSRNLLTKSAVVTEKSFKSPEPKRLITTNSQEMELRSAPPKPKSLVPPALRLGVDSQKLKKQGSSDKTPTPTQQAHLKKLKSQTSEEEERMKKETLLQRQILFDELDELEERIEHFKADAKSENISVQGAKKFEKIVNFNKQLRQFKKVHDRNKLICQESLREDEQEEENFVPELPKQKELSILYKDFEKPKLVKSKSEQALKEFHEKHKKLMASYIHQREQKAEEKSSKNKNKIASPILSDKIIDKFPTSYHESEVEKKEEVIVADIPSKSLKDLKEIEKEIFKSIESLNADSDEVPVLQKQCFPKEEDYAAQFKFDKPEDMLKSISSLKYINPLSTSIDETMFESLPRKENKIKSEGNSKIRDIKHLIDKFDSQKANLENIRNTTDKYADTEFHAKTNWHNTKDKTEVKLNEIGTDVNSKNTSNKIEKATEGNKSSISNEIIELYTQKSKEIVSPLEGWTDRTNSMNKEVINFEEELLNYEADSLNPPDKEQKEISYMNSKRLRKISYEEKEVGNSKKDKSALNSGFLFDFNKNEGSTTEVTVLQKGYRFGSKKGGKNSNENKESEMESENAKERISKFIAVSNNRNTSGYTNQVTTSQENNSEKALFQSGFLLNGNANSKFFDDNKFSNRERKFKNGAKPINVETSASNENNATKVLNDQPLPQSCFLLNSDNIEKAKKLDLNNSIFDSKAEVKSSREEKVLQTTSSYSNVKSRFLLSTGLDAMEVKNKDITENGKDYPASDFETRIRETYQTTQKDITSKTPNKKSVHFDSNPKSQVDTNKVSPVKSFFPSVEPITSEEEKTKVPETSQYEKGNEKRMTNGILTNLNNEHHSSRKESLDSVDMELIKLGLHKSSDDIRSQYLSKLHITSPPSKISLLIRND